MMYASEIAARSLKIAPAGPIYRGPSCHCAMCSRPLATGDHAAAQELPRSFTDFQYLGDSGVICGHCKAVTVQSVMRSFQRSVITTEGVYPLNTDAARAWFWMTPPKPPFVVIFNHSSQGTFHYIWRTPVTLDTRLIYANLDGQVVQVNQPQVLKALDWTTRMSDALVAEGAKSPLTTPFVVLSRDTYRSPGSSHANLRKDVLELAQRQPHFLPGIAFFQALGPGEWFALSSMLKQKPVPPAQPVCETTV